MESKVAAELIQYDIPKWIEENKDHFKPPVCNKCLYNDQLTVFIVGGPNIRKDYHLEKGEEFFFQLKGDMCLKVVEKGVFKDVNIKEGQVFLLPSRMLHSPQRYENTVGLVVERRRAPWEHDSLRYHVEGTTDVLFERWIHLKDIVRDLPPIIQEYFSSEAHRTGIPTSSSVIANRPYDADYGTTIESPFSLKQWIQERKEELRIGKPLPLFGPPKYKTQVIVHGPGEYNVGYTGGDTLIYQFEGSSEVTAGQGAIYSLTENTTILIPIGKQAKLQVKEGYAFTVAMDQPENEDGKTL